MLSFGDLLATLYEYRVLAAVASAVVAATILLVAWRAGWIAALRRRPRLAIGLAAVALVVGLPITWYLASPLFIRTELVEPPPVAAVVATPAPEPSTSSHARTDRLVLRPRPRRHGRADRGPADAGAACRPALGVVQRHGRVPLRARHGDADRDRPRRVDDPPRGLQRPQRAGPVRLPVAGREGLREGGDRGRAAQGDGRELQRPAPRRDGPVGHGERPHLVQAVLAPVRLGDAGGLTPNRSTRADRSLLESGPVPGSRHHGSDECRRTRSRCSEPV